MFHDLNPLKREAVMHKSPLGGFSLSLFFFFLKKKKTHSLFRSREHMVLVAKKDLMGHEGCPRLFFHLQIFEIISKACP